MILAVVVFVLTLFATGCSDDRKLVNVALKKEGKVYMLPFIAEPQTLEFQLSNNETPTLIKDVDIVKDKDILYVTPEDFLRILNLIADNYILYDKQEGAFDGYVGFGRKEVIKFGTKQVNTDKIGKQIRKQIIVLENPKSKKQMEIIWSDDPKPLAYANCVVKSLWTLESPYPGRTIGNYKDTVLINLNQIVDFYNNGMRLEYNEKEEMLYLIK